MLGDAASTVTVEPLGTTVSTLDDVLEAERRLTLPVALSCVPTVSEPETPSPTLSVSSVSSSESGSSAPAEHALIAKGQREEK